MASTFPGAIDNFTDPLSNSSLASPSHAGQHSDLNDAVEKIETYMGLVKVIPTSVTGTGVSLATNGTVTCTAASSVEINGCFTSLYANYFVTFNLASSLSGWYTGLRLRASGVAKSTNYDLANFVATASGVLALDSNGAGQTQARIGGQNTTLITGHAYILNPQIASPTHIYGSLVSTGQHYQHQASQTETYQADGFQIFASGNAATYTGTIRVYGYRN